MSPKWAIYVEWDIKPYISLSVCCRWHCSSHEQSYSTSRSVSTEMGDHLPAGILPRYVTSQLDEPSFASIRGHEVEYLLLIGWGKSWNVTSVRWQVTLCDPIWHVISRSGGAVCYTAFTLLLPLCCAGNPASSGWVGTAMEGAGGHDVGQGREIVWRKPSRAVRAELWRHWWLDQWDWVTDHYRRRRPRPNHRQPPRPETKCNNWDLTMFSMFWKPYPWRCPVKTVPILSIQNGPHTLQVLSVFRGPTYYTVHLNFICMHNNNMNCACYWHLMCTCMYINACIHTIHTVIRGGSVIGKHIRSHFTFEGLLFFFWGRFDW